MSIHLPVEGWWFICASLFFSLPLNRVAFTPVHSTFHRDWKDFRFGLHFLPPSPFPGPFSSFCLSIFRQSSSLSHYSLKHHPGLYRITHILEILHWLFFTLTGLGSPQYASVSGCSRPFRYFHLYRLFFLSKQRPGIGPRALGVVTFLLHAHHLTTGPLICLNLLEKVGSRCSFPLGLDGSQWSTLT